MTLDLLVPPTTHIDFVPRITVIGVGGGGTNAVDNMIALKLQGVDFVVANTDAQQLQHSKADRRIQLGPHITQGLGAGAKPEIGRAAAEEAADELYRHLDHTHMVFITAGMGGGTGTGAAPVIARMARERNILTVGVVTKPFTFEGARRAKAADAGIEELQQYVDTLIVIPNQNLFRLANEKTGWGEAFKMADDVLYMGVRGVTDLMITPGLVNLDFADIRAVMAEMGKAMMGTGEADGENRAIRASEAAISNPLLEDTSMAGARGLLINITGGDDMTLFEVDAAANRIREEVDEDANIIFGSAIDPALTGRIRVSVVATGIDSPPASATGRPRLVAVEGMGTPAVAEAELANGTTGQALPQGYAQQAYQQPGQHTSFGGPGYGATMPNNPGGRAPQRTTGYTTEAADHAGYGSPRPAPPRQGAYLTQVSQAPEPAPPLPPAVSRTLFSEPAAPMPPPPPSRSLFGLVTGAFRRAPLEPAMMPNTHREADDRRASVRPTSAEEAAIDIPAFLRRQQS